MIDRDLKIFSSSSSHFGFVALNRQSEAIIFFFF